MLVCVGFIILTLVGSVLSGNKPSKCHSCPKNEHYTKNNPRCIRTCANKWKPICYDCKPFTGCVCNDGFVRQKDDGSGHCVPERKCRHSCPKNEHYTKNNPRCIRTCANKWKPICDDCKPVTGCVCNDGFVRQKDDGSGPCIPERKCH